MWVLDYNDPRFFPFEGLNPSEGFTLSFNLFKVGDSEAEQQALLESISDIVFHINYNIYPHLG